LTEEDNKEIAKQIETISAEPKYNLDAWK